MTRKRDRRGRFLPVGGTWSQSAKGARGMGENCAPNEMIFVRAAGDLRGSEVSFVERAQSASGIEWAWIAPV